MPLAVASREQKTDREQREQRHEDRRENQDLRSMRNRRRRPIFEGNRRYVRRGAGEIVEQPVEVGPALKIIVARALHTREQSRIAVRSLGLVALGQPNIEYVDGAATEFELDQYRR